MLFAVVLFWGLHLGYPVHQLQHIRWTLFGYLVPVYYFFTVLPMVGIATVVLALKRHWTKWELIWCLLPLICLPGILQSDDSVWSVRQCLSWVVRGLVPGGIIFIVAHRKQAESQLVHGIYPVIIGASLLGLMELYFDHNPLWDKSLTPIPVTAQPDNPFYRPVPPPIIPSTIGRPQGTQGNRIPYAAVLVAFLPIGLWLLKYGEKGSYWARLAALGALFSILLLAQVRAVWVSMVAAILLMHVVRLHQDLRLRIIAGLLVGVGIFLAFPKTRDLLWTRLSSFRFTERSIQARIEVLQTVKVLREHGLWGVGFGQFPTACKPYYPRTLVWNNTPDNQYLRWTIENGVLAFGLLLAFFVGLIRAGWKRIQLMPDSRQADFYKSLLVGWASIAVTFLFFDGFYWAACNMTFWCFLGLFAVCLKPERGN
ncbi:MAG: O-antigen ligase family protein [Elusimicrobia bacterium]|nr:O-antigen ligase family protein [Elusimicrobiota bacterium]